MTHSPRLNDLRIDKSDDAYVPPVAHTAREIGRLVSLASERRAVSIAIGHGADAASTTAVQAFTDAWLATDGIVLCTIRWPERGASWLSPARRLTAVDPDLYVLGGAPAGLAQMILRLVWSTTWSAQKTIGFTSASSPTMHQLAGRQNLDGLVGATATGGTWNVANTIYTEFPPKERA
ncbi:MAG TPA: hypothetical protein VIJ86_05345 [Acidimicrobiales bacterium]